LCSLASWKALLIPYLHKKFQKISIHHHLKPSCPKQQWPKFGHCGPFVVKRADPALVLECYVVISAHSIVIYCSNYKPWEILL
jgi:hypothetical protein